MKQKHSKGPDGEVRHPPTSGRGRGRPRKNPYQRLDPRTEDFFKTPEREGGPVDPLICFEEVYMTIFSQQKDPHTKEKPATQEELRENMHNYPIFKQLTQFSNLIDENGKLMQVQVPSMGQPGVPMNQGLAMPQPPMGTYQQRMPQGPGGDEEHESASEERKEDERKEQFEGGENEE